jgi:dihydroflavonol-4-reductase
MSLCLVTGATGFIGSNLCRQLVTDGHRVRILRRPNADLRALAGIQVEHAPGDILDRQSLQEAAEGCHTVFHAAAVVSFQKKLQTLQFDVNVGGTRNIVDACLSAGVWRLVHVSSIAAIGHTDDGTPASEDVPYNWGTLSSYRYTKHLAEQEVLAGVDRGLAAVIVNPSVVIGEGDMHFHGGEILRSVKKGRALLYPDGGMTVGYVGDVVQGMISAAMAGRTGERYILGGESLTYKEVFVRTARLVGGRPPFAKLPSPLLRFSARAVERTAELLGLHPPLTEGMVVGTTRCNWYSSEKAIRELGYHITPFDDAVTAAYRWYRANGLL